MRRFVHGLRVLERLLLVSGPGWHARRHIRWAPYVSPVHNALARLDRQGLHIELTNPGRTESWYAAHS